MLAMQLTANELNNNNNNNNKQPSHRRGAGRQHTARQPGSQTDRRQSGSGCGRKMAAGRQDARSDVTVTSPGVFISHLYTFSILNIFDTLEYIVLFI